jgi:hypothetical protein
MKKEISYSQFQQVKSAAKLIDKPVREIEALKKKIMPLVAEMKSKQEQVELLEAGIVKVIGFHVSDLVKKVIEPNGKTDKNGKPLKETTYLATDIVSYDEVTKEYVITVPEENIEATEEPEETVVPEEDEQEETLEEEVEANDSDDIFS